MAYDPRRLNGLLIIYPEFMANWSEYFPSTQRSGIYGIDIEFHEPYAINTMFAMHTPSMQYLSREFSVVGDQLAVLECYNNAFNHFMTTGVIGRTMGETLENQEKLRYIARWLCFHGIPEDPLDWGLVRAHSGLND